MRHRRLVAGGALVGALLAVAVGTVAAQGFNSETEDLIRTLNRQLLYLAIPITILVQALLWYAVWRFWRSGDAKETQENRRLEITWTLATAIILVFVGVASYQVLADMSGPAGGEAIAGQGNTVEIDVIGIQWLWQFEYREENVTSRGTMVVPANETIYLNITSQDVIHAVHAPELGLKQDSIPGQSNVIQFVPTKTGTYQLYCSEYCGSGHSQMLGEIRVVSQQEYQQWLDENREGGGGGGNSTNQSAVGPPTGSGARAR